MHQQFTVFSKHLGYDKHLRVWLPKGYFHKDTHYPVLYMHDGQNLFHKKHASYGMVWAMDKVLNQIGLEAIVVGVDSAAGDKRLIEYSPWVMDERFGHSPYTGMGGKGTEHAAFLVEQLLPWIEENYRTTQTRLIGGSSLGGVMSLYMGAHYPEKFSKVLAMSTAAWIFEKEMLDTICLYQPSHQQRIYLDVGTAESEEEGYAQAYLESNHKLRQALEAQEVMSKFVQEAGAHHNEIAWHARLPYALRYLFDLSADKSTP